ADKNRWGQPLLQMRAEIRILRSLALSGTDGPGNDETIAIPYRAIDWQRCRGVANGPHFPELSAGEVFVFPLKNTGAHGEKQWQLIDEENFGLLTPAVRERPVRGSERAAEFLVHELAAAFATGEYHTVFQAAQYCGFSRWKREVRHALSRDVASLVGDRKDKWLAIGTACYSAGPVQRPKVAELLEEPPEQPYLLAQAFGQLDREALDDLLIAESMKHCDLHAWGTAVTISLNYLRHPTAIREMTEALANDRPGALYVAGFVVRQPDHPVVAVAVKAASRALAGKQERLNSEDLRSACQLIRDYGDEEAFAQLLAEFRKAQKDNFERYVMLWQSCAYVKHERLLPICALLIEDVRPWPHADHRRVCDHAAAAVQYVTGEDLGYSWEATPAERGKAIDGIKVYLAGREKRRGR
ncbi:unnamed protein product, partial [marine sediment metagenome]